jgi:hypothetical protein
MVREMGAATAAADGKARKGDDPDPLEAHPEDSPPQEHRTLNDRIAWRGRESD